MIKIRDAPQGYATYFSEKYPVWVVGDKIGHGTMVCMV
jgi:hypothetical protein